MQILAVYAVIRKIATIQDTKRRVGSKPEPQEGELETYDKGLYTLYLNFPNAILIHDLDFVLFRGHDQPLRDFIKASPESGKALLHRGLGIVVATP